MRLHDKQFNSLSDLEFYAIKNLFPFEYNEDKKRIAYFNDDGCWWLGVFMYNKEHIIDYNRLGVAWPISCANNEEYLQIGNSEFLICLYDKQRDPGVFISHYR